jgi:hypothetical protein
MSSDYNSATPAEPAGYRDIGLPADWSERVITVVATSTAVLIVTIVAVLMGMA